MSGSRGVGGLKRERVIVSHATLRKFGLLTTKTEHERTAEIEPRARATIRLPDVNIARARKNFSL